MRHILIICSVLMAATGLGQEIRRISKAGADIDALNAQYVNAIASSNNPKSKEIAYKNKDSLLFLKDLDAFFTAFEESLRTEPASSAFISSNKRLEYVLFVSNTGYTDAFYYDFENGKISLSFISALKTFVTNHKWENVKKAKFTHRGYYVFK